MKKQNKLLFIALFLVLIMLFSVLSIGLSANQSITSTDRSKSSREFNQYMSSSYMKVPTQVSSVSSNATLPYSGKMSVLVTFSLSNQSRLNSLLYNLSNTQSSQYHKFLTRNEFTSNFSVSRGVYRAALEYFSQYFGIKIKKYQDRVSIGLSGPSNIMEKIFDTKINSTPSVPSIYYASSSPELPSTIGNYVSVITGLSNKPLNVSLNLNENKIAGATGNVKKISSGYPTPCNSAGVQYIYGSDLQVAYNEQTLLNITYPTKEVIATILWAGTNSSGNPVGPFDPSDIYNYYNATLPSYEPHSKVYGVPINGARKPGVSASYDKTGANVENTLDLEMVGSTAPGSSIYNVYGINSTMANIDSSFAFILNPNATYSKLNNVSVISNSWGTGEYNNTAWVSYLEEAQARGISVLASSGDSGDNVNSSKCTGAQIEFPSAMAYNNFGVTAVGGDTLNLTSSLHILNETAWYISSSDTSDSGPAGSTGGISNIFREPSWQLNTEANNTLLGKGRGVPDISAIANNTLLYLSCNGTQYREVVGGTSIASPIEAGIVGEMDAILNHSGQRNIGYLNPMIYSLANREMSSPSITSTEGYLPTGKYTSKLPTLPFYNVNSGRNHVYKAHAGYNLVTGWGSINAYNFTMYVLNQSQSNYKIGLKGVYDSLNLSGLKVTSYLYNKTTSSYTTVNRDFNASIQQNFFIANEMGAPIYWIQNVIYINGSQSTGWEVNYTGWVVYPFYGQYPSLTLYRYNYPAGKLIQMPHTFIIKSWLSNYTTSMGQIINFEVNSHIIHLPVPGAAYIIGSLNYKYSLNGKTYYNGPYPDNSVPGGLDPQFGLIGGPSGGKGDFANNTAGKVTACIEPMDKNSYVPASTKTYGENIDETGESASNLAYAENSGNSWSLSVANGSTEQGVLSYYSASRYNVTFSEKGLPTKTPWYVNITGGGSSGPITGSSYVDSLTNGTYPYSIQSSNKSFETLNKSYQLSVKGNNETVYPLFLKTYKTTFVESGLSSESYWYVNITNASSLKVYSSGKLNVDTFSTHLFNGSYTYTVQTNNKSYKGSNATGTFKVNGTSIKMPESTFNIVAYNITFVEMGLPTGSVWYVNITGHDSGPITGVYYNLTLTNGSYSYTIGTTNHIYSANGGKLTVIGQSVTERISFTQNAITANPNLFLFLAIILLLIIIIAVVVVSKRR
jgi:hypothetical protein